MSMSICVYTQQMQEQNHFVFIQCREQRLITSRRIKEALYGISHLDINLSTMQKHDSQPIKTKTRLCSHQNTSSY